jgi:hypothetical protein
VSWLNGGHDVGEDDADRERLMTRLERVGRRSGWVLDAFVLIGAGSASSPLIG